MAALREREAMAALALAFLILTAARSGEVLGARWAEIDLAAKVWTIPATRMKAGRRIHEAAWAFVAGLGRGDGSSWQSLERYCAPAPRRVRRYRNQARPLFRD